MPPKGIADAFARAKEMLPLLKVAPKKVRKAPCQQIVQTGDEIDLTELPILKCWPLDGDLASVGYPADVNEHVPGTGHPDISEAEWNARYRGRFITMAGIHTIHQDDEGDARPSSHNIGMYRVQLVGKNRLAMHWHVHHDGASHWRSWKRAGKPMPIAIVLGGESVLPYAATCPLPPGIGELLMAGFLNGKGISLVDAQTVPCACPPRRKCHRGYVRTDAGHIGWDPRDPPADHWAKARSSKAPLATTLASILCQTATPLSKSPRSPDEKTPSPPSSGCPPRRLFHGQSNRTHHGGPAGLVIHDIDDYDLPMFGAFHNCAFVQIHKAYPLQGRRLMHAIWGTGQMAWTKSIFVVDQDVDVQTPSGLEAAARYCRPDRDIERVNGPLDILDHAAPRLGAGTKIG